MRGIDYTCRGICVNQDRAAMKDPRVSLEVESEIYYPNCWLVFFAGLVFLLPGIAAFFVVQNKIMPGIALWIAEGGTALFILVGVAVCVWSLGRIITPGRVRHAAADALPKVPQEPLIHEGSVVIHGLTHKLVEDGKGWHFHPTKGWLRSKVYLIGFGVPFLVGFAALLTWTFHAQLGVANWLVSGLCATCITILCGGTVLFIAGFLIQVGYRQLCRLDIPRRGDELTLYAIKGSQPEDDIVKEGTMWDTLRQNEETKHVISRESVVAVQLCPWKYALGDSYQGTSYTWAVQGLLILSKPEEDQYRRVPLLLCGDFRGAARLMRRLADVLLVPYLFGADTEGWQAECSRAKTRPPLRSGGIQ